MSLDSGHYRTEITPPKQGAEKLGERLNRFADRFKSASSSGLGVCVTDNAMGRLAFQGNELIEELALSAKGTMIHLNTFHTLNDLHWILDSCADLGVKELLVVSGDGSARLPKLKPSEIGCQGASVTSVELLAYIKRHYGSKFTLGAAFNQYEPAEHEIAKLKRKLDSGAEFFTLRKCSTIMRAIRPDMGEAPLWISWIASRIFAAGVRFTR